MMHILIKKTDKNVLRLKASRTIPLIQLGVARFFLVQDTKMGKNIPNHQKVFQMTLKYTQWQQNITNRHKIHQHPSLQDLPKFTQITIFGLKIYNLATLTNCIVSRAKSVIIAFQICTKLSGRAHRNPKSRWLKVKQKGGKSGQGMSLIFNIIN
jgi:hypothetical protein